MLGRAGLLLLTSVFVAAGCAGGGTPGSTAEKHYRDRAGWSLKYPGWMHLERSQISSRISIHEVTVASFAPRGAIRSGTNGQSTWIKVDPPRPGSGDFPAEGVAFRVYRLEGGPPVVERKKETRLPLHLGEFRTSSDYPATFPRPVAMPVSVNGGNYAVYAWTGPKAPPRVRAALASVVSSLAFPRP